MANLIPDLINALGGRAAVTADNVAKPGVKRSARRTPLLSVDFA